MPAPPRAAARRAARATTPPKGRPTPARAKQGKPKGPTLTYLGKEYRVAASVGVWPLMQFARAAEAGLDMRDQKGLAALHAFLQDVIHPDDWGRFQDDMITSKISNLDELMSVAQQAVEEMQKRAAKKRANGAAANGHARRAVAPAGDPDDDEEDGEQDEEDGTDGSYGADDADDGDPEDYG